MNEKQGSSGVVTVVLCAVGIVVLLVAGGIAALDWSMFDTQYTPGFSEKEFNSIKIGDTEREMLSTLGTPFYIRDAEPYVDWIYSAVEQQSFSTEGTGSGTYTSIRFDEAGRVDKIFGERQTSATSAVVFGEGQNYLKLTRDQIGKLIGKS